MCKAEKPIINLAICLNVGPREAQSDIFLCVFSYATSKKDSAALCVMMDVLHSSGELTRKIRACPTLLLLGKRSSWLMKRSLATDSSPKTDWLPALNLWFPRPASNAQFSLFKRAPPSRNATKTKRARQGCSTHLATQLWFFYWKFLEAVMKSVSKVNLIMVMKTWRGGSAWMESRPECFQLQ